MLLTLVLLVLFVRDHVLIRPAYLYRHRPAIRRKATRSRRKPAWVRAEIIRLKALSDLSCHKLAATFNRMHAARNGMTVSKTWVAEVVRAHRYEVADLRRRFKRHVPPAQPCNAVWGVDFTGKADLAKRIHPVLGVIDYGSRSALVLRPLPNRTAITTLKALLAAMETYGVPAAIQTDNEAVFTSRLFRFSLRLLGIRHRLSAPGAPWQNGWIERLFGTLKEKLDRVAVAGFDDLRLAMGEFRFWYNHVRPHQHLQGWTPAEAWRGLDPYAHVPESVEHFRAWDGLLRGVYLRR